MWEKQKENKPKKKSQHLHSFNVFLSKNNQLEISGLSLLKDKIIFTKCLILTNEQVVYFTSF